MTLVDRVSGWRRAAPLLVGPLRTDARALEAWHAASEAFMPELAAPTTEGACARPEWRRSIRRVHTQFVRRHHYELMEIIGERDLVNALVELGSVFPGVVASA